MGDGTDILSAVPSNREVKVSTDGEWFRYIKRNWLGAYIIIQPSQDTDTWKALACWGNEDQLVADTPEILIDLIRHHYGPETEGYTQMLMARMGQLMRKYS